MKTKLPHYIAPLYPAAALLVAAAWEERLQGIETRAWRLSERVLAYWGCLVVAAFIALIGMGPWLLQPLAGSLLPNVGPGPALVAGVLGAGWIGALLLFCRRRHQTALVILGASQVAMLLSLQLTLAPVVARYWRRCAPG